MAVLSNAEIELHINGNDSAGLNNYYFNILEFSSMNSLETIDF